MMPEHDPQPARGSESDVDDPRPTALGIDADSVVQMSTRRPAPVPDPQGPSVDDTVVDLRPGAAAAGQQVEGPDAVVPVERRSPEVVAAPSVAPSAPAPAEELTPAAVPPRSALSHRVLRAVSPALVVVVLAAVLAGVAVARSGSAAQDAERWDRLARVGTARAAEVDAVWSAVLASVAAGVGQPVPSGEQLPDLLGVASQDLGAEPPDDSADPELGAADSARGEFVDDVRAALDRSAGSPLELGNELEALDRSHGVSAAASVELVERADALSAAARARMPLRRGRSPCWCCWQVSCSPRSPPSWRADGCAAAWTCPSATCNDWSTASAPMRCRTAPTPGASRS